MAAYCVGGRGGRRGAAYQLRPPRVVGAGISFYGPGVVLAQDSIDALRHRQLQRRPWGDLRAPVVINPAVGGFIASPLNINYWVAVKSKQNTQLQRRAPYYRLFAPVVVGGSIAFHGPGIRLVRPNSGVDRSRYRAKSVLGKPLVSSVTLAPPLSINYWAAVKSKQNSGLSRRLPFSSILRPPRAAAFIPSPLNVNYWAAVKSKQNTQLQRRAPYYRLFPPILPLLAPRIRVALTEQQPPRTERRLAFPRLLPPAVVGSGISFGGPRSKLAYSLRGRPKSVLFPPIIPALARPIEGELTVQLARILSERRLAFPRLLPPAVIAAGIAFSPVTVWLAPSFRGKPRSRLFTPIIPPLARPVDTEISVQLVRALFERRLAFPRLLPPAVVGAGIVSRPVRVELTYSQRGRPRSFLLPPVIPALARPIESELTLQLTRVLLERRLAYPRLLPPAVVGAGIVFRPVHVELTYSGRGLPKSHLSLPTVVQAATISVPISIALARIAPPRPQHWLGAPVVVQAGITFAAVSVKLAPSRRGSPRSRLLPPIIEYAVAAVETVLRIQLAQTPGRRVASHLSPPAAVVVFAPIGISLASSSRGRPNSRLAPPIIPPLARPTESELTVQLARVLTERKLSFSHLFPPAVIGAGLSFGGPRTKLTYSKRGRPSSRLQPPVITGAGIVFAPVAVSLALSRRGKPSSHLFPPVIQPLARPLDAELSVQLARVLTERRLSFSKLLPPAVVGAGIVYRGLLLHIAPSPKQDRATHSGLGRPIVIGEVVPTDAFGGISVTLTNKRPPHTFASLRAPVVIETAVSRPLQIELAYSRRRRATSFLRAPIIPLLAQPIRLALARVSAPRTHTILLPTPLVGAGIVFEPLDVTLAPSHQIGRQRHYEYRLSPPAVVQSASLLFFGPQTALTYSVRGKPKFQLKPPAVVGAGVVFRQLQVELTYSRRGTPKSHLFAPIIPPLARPVDFELSVQLARAQLERRLAFPRLLPPTVVGAGIVFAPVTTWLTYSRRGTPISFLQPPALVGAGVVFSPVQIALAPARRGRPSSLLRVPEFPPVAAPIRVTLARIRPVRTLVELRAPAVVGGGIVFRPLAVDLAPSYQIGRQRRVEHLLLPPAVVQAATLLFFGPRVALTPSKHGRPLSELRPPTVVGAGLSFGGPRIKLAPSQRGRAKSVLRSPVIPSLAQPISITLAPTQRPQPFSVLHAPALLPPLARPVAAELSVNLVRARLELRLAVSKLQPPAVVTQPIFPSLAITLVRIRPVRVQSRLAEFIAEQVVFAAVRITLAPSRRPHSLSQLRPPTVIGGGIAFFGPRTVLTPARRGLPKSLLFEPVLVEILPRPISVRLAPKPPTHVIYQLKQPQVVRQPGITEITTRYTRIRPVAVTSVLFPPAVVGAGVVFQPIATTLVRIRPVPTKHMLTLVTRPFPIQHGDVCGFVFTPTEVCDGTETPTSVTGDVSTSSHVDGRTGSASSSTGSASSGSNVSGSTRKAT